jgi:hypothetical protein
MPFLIPLLLGAGAGAYTYNKFDDAFIDPLFGNTQEPLLSVKNIAIGALVVVGVMYAKKKRYI